MKRITLYVAGNGWAVGPAGAGAPLIEGVHSAIEEADWSAVADGIRAAHGKVLLRVLMSSRVCRHHVAWWSSDCRTPKALRERILEAFSNGSAVDDRTHQIEIAWPRYGDSTLAIAFPRESIAAIETGLNKTGLRLETVDSTVATVFRRHASRIKEAHALIAYAETDGICGIELDKRRVTQVDTLPTDGRGMACVDAWCRRKQCQFERDAQLTWMETGVAPDAFMGRILPVPMRQDAIASPMRAGYALIEASR